MNIYFKSNKLLIVVFCLIQPSSAILAADDLELSNNTHSNSVSPHSALLQVIDRLSVASPKRHLDVSQEDEKASGKRSCSSSPGNRFFRTVSHEDLAQQPQSYIPLLASYGVDSQDSSVQSLGNGSTVQASRALKNRNHKISELSVQAGNYNISRVVTAEPVIRNYSLLDGDEDLSLRGFFNPSKGDQFRGKSPLPREVCDKEKTFALYGGEAAYKEFFKNNPGFNSFFSVGCANANCKDASCAPAAVMTPEESFALENIPFGFCSVSVTPVKKKVSTRLQAQKSSNIGSNLDDNL